MCTLTYVPKNSGFILTSSRDEVVSRPTLAPAEYYNYGQFLIYPKDLVKNGTWLAMGKNTIACLLNGSIEQAFLKEKYLESRGTLVLKSYKFTDIESFLKEESFNEVPPFTLLLINTKNTRTIDQISWNGKEKLHQKFNSKKPRIWSSATLYNEKQRMQRQNWFDDLLQNNKDLSSQNLLEFHEQKHTSDDTSNILMKRNDDKQTTSISQIIIDQNEHIFKYKNLIDCETKNFGWTKEEMDLL